MKNIAITGADGFIGSHLTEALLAEGYHVRALAQYNSFNNWGWLEEVSHPELEVVTGDVRDPNFCRHFVKGADTVFHLAALIAIPFSCVAPDSSSHRPPRSMAPRRESPSTKGIRSSRSHPTRPQKSVPTPLR